MHIIKFYVMKTLNLITAILYFKINEKHISPYANFKLLRIKLSFEF